MNTNPAAKRILVYGDSFVFGRMTGKGRYAANERFTGVMQDTLGPAYEIVEEGLRGRMLVGENKFFPWRNGLEQFKGILGSHLPLDMVIFFLGTNDMNAGSEKTVAEIQSAWDEYLHVIDEWCAFFQMPKPQILLLCPPFVQEKSLPEMFQKVFIGAEAKSKELPAIYEAWANKNTLHYFDLNQIVHAADIDGIHIDAEGHKVLGMRLSQIVKEIVG